MQCIKTRTELLKSFNPAVIRTCIFGDAATFINKDCRVLFGDISIVPFLGPALGWTAMSPLGGESWLQLTGMICPWAGNLTAIF